jgi:hypothetical protein
VEEGVSKIQVVAMSQTVKAQYVPNHARGLVMHSQSEVDASEGVVLMIILRPTALVKK